MGLTMSEKKALTQEIARRYQKAGKKGKTKILDEFVKTTGYNRKYALHILATWGKTVYAVLGGKRVRLTAQPKKARKKRAGKVIYGEEVIAVLTEIWGFFDYMCGKRLAAFMRRLMDFLVKDFHISPEVREKLMKISPSTIDRRLKGERAKWKLKGKSTTKPGTVLRNQIAVRTFYSWDERLPGFFELDTVAHCGERASGQFCYTLDATDVYSGWVELRALRNRAHIWVKQEVSQFPGQLPFPLRGIDSDNGDEFINYQLKEWCETSGVAFTRSRSYHKNDNCFVEQKNDMTVRKTVGYRRYDTDAERDALAKVYQYLCPLLNYFYPSAKITAKDRVGSKVKKTYDLPKSPYERLLESPDLPDSVKKELRKRAAKLHPVKQKHLVNQALDELFALHGRKNLSASGPDET